MLQISRLRQQFQLSKFVCPPNGLEGDPKITLEAISEGYESLIIL